MKSVNVIHCFCPTNILIDIVVIFHSMEFTRKYHCAHTIGIRNIYCHQIYVVYTKTRSIHRQILCAGGLLCCCSIKNNFTLSPLIITVSDTFVVSFFPKTAITVWFLSTLDSSLLTLTSIKYSKHFWVTENHWIFFFWLTVSHVRLRSSFRASTYVSY